MRVFAMLDGAKFPAADEADLVRLMHLDSWSPADSDAQFMKETAERARIQTGNVVRYDNARNFVADLIEAGLVTELTVH